MVGTRDKPAGVVLGDVVRRWWLRAVAVGVVLAGLGFVYGATLPTTYTSTVRVRLSLLPGSPWSSTVVTSGQQVVPAMSSELALVTSSWVVDAVQRKLGGSVTASSIDPAVATNTDIVIIRFQATTADRSRQGAEATAQAYLDDRTLRAQSVVAVQLKVLDVQSEASKAKLRAAIASLHATPPPADADSQVAIYASQLAKLQQSAGELRRTSFAAGSVMDQPTDPTSSGGLRRWLYALVAGLAGVVGTAVLAVRQTRRGQVVRAAGLTEIHGRPILGIVRSSSRRPAADGPRVQFFDAAYVQIRTALLARLRPGSVIAVSPVDADERLSDVAVELIMSFAQAGMSAVVESAGQGSDAMRHSRDYVFVDGPPASSSDGMALALRTDAVVLTVVDGVTSRARIADVIDRSAQLAISVIGVVVVTSPRWQRRGRRHTLAVTSPEFDPAETSAADGVRIGTPEP